MKLISMTDFVLNQKQSESFNEKTFINESLISLEKIRNYANFLKQPLNIGMFVPCDDEGNFFEEPKKEEYFDDGFNFEFNQKYFKDVVLKEYYKGKEKVLFENIPIYQAKWLVNSFSTIEYLSDISNTITPIYLTKSAIKQIGL